MHVEEMRADPDAALTWAASEIASRAEHLTGDEALEAALAGLRERGATPSESGIYEARIAARESACARNERLRVAYSAPIENLPAKVELNTTLGRFIDQVQERHSDEPGAFAVTQFLARVRGGMEPSVSSPGRIISPTPFVLRDPATLPRREWLYGRHLIRGEISLTLAPGGMGKTSLACAEAAALVTGRQLLHDSVAKPLRVWLWNGEEPADELERRFGAIAVHYGLTEADFGDRLFTDTGNVLPLVLAEQSRDGVKVHTPVVDRLVEALRARAIDIMLCDPFVSTHSVNENDNSAIQRAASAWKEVAHRAGVAIGLAHHVRKLSGRDATAEDSRGGDALVSKVRDARTLNPMSSDDAARLGVPASDAKSYFSTGTGGKSNMSPKTNRKSWFRIVSIGLGNGGNFCEPEDEIAVVTAWTPPSATDSIDPGRVMRLAKVMAGQVWRSAAQSWKREDWIGRAVAEAFDLGVEDGFDARAKPLIAALEKVGVLVRDTTRDAKRAVVPIMRVGNLARYEESALNRPTILPGHQEPFLHLCQ